MEIKNKLPESNDNIQQNNRLKLVKLEVATLSPSKLNPSIRTQEKTLKSLKKSLLKHGQLEPITVKKQGNKIIKIVNGHRRYASFQSLGWKWIDGIVIHNITDYDSTFTAMHEDTLKINAVMECERWLKGATNISASTQGRIVSLQSRLGKGNARSVIKRCVEINRSPGTIASALRNYEKYVGDVMIHDQKSNMNFAYWLLNTGSSWQFSNAIAALIPVELLVKYVNNKEPIPKNWVHKLGETK